MISTDPKSYGWIAGVPAGMQELPKPDESPEENPELDA